MKWLIIFILIATSNSLFSSRFYFEIDKISGINGSVFLTQNDSNAYYDLSFDEFSQSIQLNRVFKEDQTLKRETKLIDNSLLMGVSKNEFYPALALYQNDKLFISKPYENQVIETNIRVRFLEDTNFAYYSKANVIFFNNRIYHRKKSDFDLIQKNVISASFDGEKLYYLIQNQNDLVLKCSAKPNKSLRLDYATQAELIGVNDGIIILSHFSESTLISFIDSDLNLIKSKWFDKVNTTKYYNNKLYFGLASGLIQYFPITGEERIISEGVIKDMTIYEDKLLLKINSEYFLLDHSEIISKIDVNKRFVKILSNRKIILANSGNEVYKLELKSNRLWLINYIFIENGFYLLLILLLIISLTLIKRIREKNIMLRSVFDLPNSGIIIHLNKNGIILNINKSGRNFLNLPESVSLGKYYKYYLDIKGFEDLTNLIEKALEIKTEFSQKINITFKRNLYEYICHVTAIEEITGAYKGIIINALDITEELERKRLSNWAQLAHDMQTNLSIIKLNSEQLNFNEEDDNYKRTKKIKHQVQILISRVRDIVTVGRSTKIDKNTYNTIQIFDELIDEFEIDKNLLKKDIEEFMISCDKGKLIRALRNALENALKALPENGGQIILKCKRDNRFAYLYIIDNGRGMSEKTRKGMVEPFFTTRNTSGGSGIGTIVMQNVMEQHGGEIIINSAIGEGTEIVFKIPNLNR